MGSSTIPPRCDNCSFSTWLVGLSRHILMCPRKVNPAGKWYQVRLGASCANFEPSGAFKANPQAPRPIPLTRGEFALVDARDYYRLTKYNWHVNVNGNTIYATRKERGKSVMMHRVIMDAPDHLSVDHIDHNGLNNRRSNLRLCTHAQNACNKLSRYGASRFKGVYWNKIRKKWVVTIQHNNKIYHIGYFEDQIAAAKAYDKKAAELHGEFACLNFPPKKIKD
jgi:hypothetical protein